MQGDRPRARVTTSVGAKSPAEQRRDCLAALAREPGNVRALLTLGALAGQENRFEEALSWFDRAAAVSAHSAEAHYGRGKALKDLGRPEDALAAYERATQFSPRFARAHNNKGNILAELGRLDDARASFEAAARAEPRLVEAPVNLAALLERTGRPEEALGVCASAIDRGCPPGPLLLLRGRILEAQERSLEAIVAFEGALASDASLTEARLRLGRLLIIVGRHGDAVLHLSSLARAAPNDGRAWFLLGTALRFLNRDGEAEVALGRALALAPDNHDALEQRSACLLSLGRHEEALRAYAQLFSQAPDHPLAAGMYLHAKMLCCEWAGLHTVLEAGVEALSKGIASLEPFGLQAICDDPATLQNCARQYAQFSYPQVGAWPGGRAAVDARIRIGYVSGEFRQQATAMLIAELLELHDKQHFEVTAFDNGFDDGSALRKRIERSVDHLVDVSRLSDAEAVAAVRDRKIEILVNLNGYFGSRRHEIFALRAAPVQVNYLGFPGTLGVSYMDYIVADRTIIPENARDFYDEKVVWLPDCYQANDRKRAIATRRFSRSELHLPEQGPVLCCFNHSYKITPETFDVWMRVLREVPTAVLWLLESNAPAKENLRREASSRGVHADRLVFASIVPPADHLARLGAADLFLDTFPCNAHTSGSDALWAGVPVLTRMGRTFPSRVGASLLRAVGLEDMVCEDLARYEARALRLAQHPGELAAVRERLARNRLTEPLFDAERFTRHLEAAFIAISERHRRGDAPAHLAVSERPAGPAEREP